MACASQQESCARVLLFRGANKDVRNYNSQTAFQVQAEPGRGAVVAYESLLLLDFEP